MQISPVRFNNFKLNKTNNTSSFGSICADANGKTEHKYKAYTLTGPNDYRIIKKSSTRIFRDLPSELAIARMLNPEQKTQIKVLGCADGSEAWGYAIALKETMGENAEKNVSIQAIDKAPHMIDAAKTGCLVLSDIERKYAEGTTSVFKEKSPVAGKGWNQYFIKTTRPEEFNKILAEYPCMKYLEHDPVVNKKIGSGLDWYEVNKQGLPNVTFECGDMLDYLEPDKEAENVVYVLANSAGYVFEKNPNDFFNIFNEIKATSKGKNVYIAMGNIETLILDNYMAVINELPVPIKMLINSLGFKNIPENELSKLGIYSTSGTSNKLYKLET